MSNSRAKSRQKRVPEFYEHKFRFKRIDGEELSREAYADLYDWLRTSGLSGFKTRHDFSDPYFGYLLVYVKDANDALLVKMRWCEDIREEFEVPTLTELVWTARQQQGKTSMATKALMNQLFGSFSHVI